MQKSTRANLLLVLTSVIWGAAFVSQDVASEMIDPFTFNAARTAFASLALFLLVCFRNKRGQSVPFRDMTPAGKKKLLIGGLSCGLLLTISSTLQQVGIGMGSGAGKAGFITALYIVLVPLVGLFFGKRVRPLLWVAVVLSAAGLYLLCINDAFTIELSDLCLIFCALGFTGHILVIDHFSHENDCVKMSLIQFFTMSVLCTICMALFEKPVLQSVLSCWFPILYVGVMSGAVGYTLQMVAQKDTNPTVASLIMSLESVFAVLTAWIIRGETMLPREYIGCAAMMCGILLTQIPHREHHSLPSCTAQGH